MASKQTEAYCLSDTDVKRVAGNTGLAILKYPELAGFADWNALVRNRARAVAVLFLVQSETSGHWIAAFDGPKRTAHVWDPLGMALDGQRAQVAPGQLQALGEQEPQFGRLLATAERAGYTPCVNHAEFQDFKPSVNTCGRWVGMRILHRKKTDAQFKAFVQAGMERDKMVGDADAWITAVTTPKLVGGQMRMRCTEPSMAGGAFEDASSDSNSSDDDDASDEHSSGSESGAESEFDADAAVRGGTLHTDAPGLVCTLVTEGLGIRQPTPVSRNLQTRLLKDLHATQDVTGAGLWSFLRNVKPFVVSSGALKGGAMLRRKKRSQRAGFVRALIARNTTATPTPPIQRKDVFKRRKATGLSVHAKGVAKAVRLGTAVSGSGICEQIDEELRGAGILERKAETAEVLEDARAKLAKDDAVCATGKRARGGAIRRAPLSAEQSEAIRQNNSVLEAARKKREAFNESPAEKARLQRLEDERLERVEDYKQYIAKNPDKEEVRHRGKTMTRGELAVKKKAEFDEWERREHPMNQKFFRPALKALTGIADAAVDILPSSVSAAYQNFAPPGSKFYKDNALIAARGGNTGGEEGDETGGDMGIAGGSLSSVVLGFLHRNQDVILHGSRSLLVAGLSSLLSQYAGHVVDEKGDVTSLPGWSNLVDLVKHSRPTQEAATRLASAITSVLTRRGGDMGMATAGGDMGMATAGSGMGVSGGSTHTRGHASAVAGGPMSADDFYTTLKPVNVYPHRLRYFSKPDSWGVVNEARKLDVPVSGYTRYDGSGGVGAAAQGGDGKRPSDPFRDLHAADRRNGHAYTGGGITTGSDRKGVSGGGVAATRSPVSSYNAQTARILAELISR